MIRVLCALLIFFAYGLPAGAVDIKEKYRTDGRDSARVNMHRQQLAPAPHQMGGELQEMQLQSLISRRQAGQQITTHMMNEINKRTIAIACLAIAWVALRWQYGARLAFRDDEIEAYRRKLDGASPDEAAQKITALENRLDSLTPVPIEEL